MIEWKIMMVKEKMKMMMTTKKKQQRINYQSASTR
jgi:hypothetical protein